MAMTLEQISQLETAKKTGQPQDMAAVLAMLMGGQNPLSPNASTNVGSNVGVGGTSVGTPLGTTPGGLGTGQDLTTQTLIDLLTGGGGPGGAEPNAPTSAPGPGPVGLSPTVQGMIDAIAMGEDPAAVVEANLRANQQDINVANRGRQVTSVIQNPVNIVPIIAEAINPRARGPANLAVRGFNTARQLGVVPAIPNPMTPAQLPAALANALFSVLGITARGANEDIGTGQVAQGTGATDVLGFLEANMGPGPIGNSGSDPGTSGGDPSVGVPGTGDAPPSPDVGPASVSTPAPADPTEGMTTTSFADPQGFTAGQLDVSIGPVGSTGPAPNVSDPNAPNVSDPNAPGPETPSGQGSAGDAGGGPGSLLANFATRNRPPRQFYTFYDRFMKEHPRDGKKLFTAYQTVARQVIAKAKSKGEAEELADRVYSDFIDPIARYVDDDEIGLATDALIRTTKDLAKKYHVPIPDRYDAVLKRQGGGKRGTV